MNDLNTSHERNILEFEIPPWNQIYVSLLELSKAVRNSGFEADVIVGVSRGGWIPARILSDLLENPTLANVTAEFYVGVAETKQEPSITQPVSVSVKDKKVLVVDDLADTGKSLKLVTSHLQNRGASVVRIATIYRKPWSITVPDYYVKETRRWVIFPWEIKETVRKLLERLKSKRETADDAKEKLISSGLDREQVETFIKEIAEEEQ
jgi:hypoxanthine phosphoribosyltransferase